MEKILSATEQFVKDRDEKIITRYTELKELGTAKTAAYRKIASEMYPPIHEATISRILSKAGLNLEKTKTGRPRIMEPAV